MGTSEFKFQIVQMADTTPEQWLKCWARRYDEVFNDYVADYDDLIAKHQSYSSDDFRRIGKWKDGVTGEAQWQPNVASVAYVVWEQAATEMPKCPNESEVAAFLDEWADRAYTDRYKNGETREKRFGPPRATTLLHFLSGGCYPIFDSRVRTAVARLCGQRKMANTVGAYLKSYVPIFGQLCECCGNVDCRTMDRALFSYGAMDNGLFVTPQRPKP